jgi:hypothetical protein
VILIKIFSFINTTVFGHLVECHLVECHLVEWTLGPKGHLIEWILGRKGHLIEWTLGRKGHLIEWTLGRMDIWSQRFYNYFVYSRSIWVSGGNTKSKQKEVKQNWTQLNVTSIESNYKKMWSQSKWKSIKVEVNQNERNQKRNNL